MCNIHELITLKLMMMFVFLVLVTVFFGGVSHSESAVIITTNSTSTKENSSGLADSDDDLIGLWIDLDFKLSGLNFTPAFSLYVDDEEIIWNAQYSGDNVIAPVKKGSHRFGIWSLNHTECFFEVPFTINENSYCTIPVYSNWGNLSMGEVTYVSRYSSGSESIDLALRKYDQLLVHLLKDYDIAFYGLDSSGMGRNKNYYDHLWFMGQKSGKLAGFTISESGSSFAIGKYQEDVSVSYEIRDRRRGKTEYYVSTFYDENNKESGGFKFQITHGSTTFFNPPGKDCAKINLLYGLSQFIRYTDHEVYIDYIRAWSEMDKAGNEYYDLYYQTRGIPPKSNLANDHSHIGLKLRQD